MVGAPSVVEAQASVIPTARPRRRRRTKKEMEEARLVKASKPSVFLKRPDRQKIHHHAMMSFCRERKAKIRLEFLENHVQQECVKTASKLTNQLIVRKNARVELVLTAPRKRNPHARRTFAQKALQVVVRRGKRTKYLTEDAIVAMAMDDTSKASIVSRTFHCSHREVLRSRALMSFVLLEKQNASLVAATNEELVSFNSSLAFDATQEQLVLDMPGLSGTTRARWQCLVSVQDFTFGFRDRSSPTGVPIVNTRHATRPCLPLMSTGGPVEYHALFGMNCVQPFVRIDETAGQRATFAASYHFDRDAAPSNDNIIVVRQQRWRKRRGKE